MYISARAQIITRIFVTEINTYSKLQCLLVFKVTYSGNHMPAWKFSLSCLRAKWKVLKKNEGCWKSTDSTYQSQGEDANESTMYADSLNGSSKWPHSVVWSAYYTESVQCQLCGIGNIDGLLAYHGNTTNIYAWLILKLIWAKASKQTN